MEFASDIVDGSAILRPCLEVIYEYKSITPKYPCGCPIDKQQESRHIAVLIHIPWRPMNTSQAKIKHFITHSLGNKLRDEGIVLSKESAELDENVSSIILRNYLGGLRNSDPYHFFTSLTLI